MCQSHTKEFEGLSFSRLVQDPILQSSIFSAASVDLRNTEHVIYSVFFFLRLDILCLICDEFQICTLEMHLIFLFKFSAMLASRGFACLAIAYFNYDDLPKILTTMDLEYFEEAVEYLLKQPDVIPDRCGVLSSSKGASLGLAMGIHLPNVTAVVCIGGMLVGDMDATYQGKDLWKAAKLDASLYDFDEQNLITIKENAFKEKLTYDNPSMPPIETAAENTHFLLICGEEDGLRSKVPLEAMSRRMRLYGREGKCHTVVYSGAGHIIEPPYNTFSGYSIYDLTGKKMILDWGGEPQGACKAQVDNWQNIMKFVEMHVRDRSPWYEQYVGKASGKGKF